MSLLETFKKVDAAARPAEENAKRQVLEDRAYLKSIGNAYASDSVEDLVLIDRLVQLSFDLAEKNVANESVASAYKAFAEEMRADFPLPITLADYWEHVEDRLYRTLLAASNT